MRVLIRYDVENVSDATYQKALQTVFSEPPVDDIYEENFDAEGGNVFSVEIPAGTVRPESGFGGAVRPFSERGRGTGDPYGDYLCDRGKYF